MMVLVCGSFILWEHSVMAVTARMIGTVTDLINDIKADRISHQEARKRARVIVQAVGNGNAFLSELKSVAAEKGIQNITALVDVPASEPVAKKQPQIMAQKTGVQVSKKSMLQASAVTIPIASEHSPISIKQSTDLPLMTASTVESKKINVIREGPSESSREEIEQDFMEAMKELYDQRWSLLPEEISAQLNFLRESLGGYDIPLAMVEMYDGLQYHIERVGQFIELMKNNESIARQYYKEMSAIAPENWNFETVRIYQDKFYKILLSLGQSKIARKTESLVYKGLLEPLLDEITGYQHILETVELGLNELEKDRAVISSVVAIPVEDEKEYKKLKTALDTLYKNEKYRELSLQEIEAFKKRFIPLVSYFDAEHRKKMVDINTFYQALLQVNDRLSSMRTQINMVIEPKIQKISHVEHVNDLWDIDEELNELITTVRAEIQEIENMTMFSSNPHVRKTLLELNSDIKTYAAKHIAIVDGILAKSEREAELFIAAAQKDPEHADLATVAKELVEAVEEKHLLAQYPEIDKQKLHTKKIEAQEKSLQDIEEKAARVKEHAVGKEVRPIIEALDKHGYTQKQGDIVGKGIAGSVPVSPRALQDQRAKLKKTEIVPRKHEGLSRTELQQAGNKLKKGVLLAGIVRMIDDLHKEHEKLTIEACQERAAAIERRLKEENLEKQLEGVPLQQFNTIKKYIETRPTEGRQPQKAAAQPTRSAQEIVNDMKNLRDELLKEARNMVSDSKRTMTLDTHTTYAVRASDLDREIEKYAASNDTRSVISKQDLRELQDTIESQLEWFEKKRKISYQATM
jgi:hypothetical protein